MYTTQRMASRVAYLREQGISPPKSPGTITNRSDAVFMSWVRSRVLPPGRELGAAYGKAWLKGWLKSEEGQEWGYTPRAT